VNEVRHYRGDAKCPVCDNPWDPETGYCPGCADGAELVLFRVQGYPLDWFDDAGTAEVKTRVVSTGYVGAAVADMLNKNSDIDLFIIQRQRA
jgi:hypothetical protein